MKEKKGLLSHFVNTKGEKLGPVNASGPLRINRKYILIKCENHSIYNQRGKTIRKVHES